MRDFSERWSSDHAIKGICLLVSAAALVGAAWARGPWLDEFWSSWLSDPHANLWRAFIDRWMLDVHPPLFVFLHYAIRQLFDFDIFGGRLVNIAFLAGAFPLFLYVRRRSSHAQALDLFAVSALTLEMFVEQILDFRSYTAVGCAVFLVLASAFVLFESGDRSRPTPDRGIWAIFAVATLVGINLHYIAGMYIDFFGATLAGAFLLTRRTRDFYRVAVILCVANAPVLAFAVAQRDYIVSCIVGGLWIDMSSTDALIVTADGLRDSVWGPLGLLALGCGLNWIWPTERGEGEGHTVALRFAVVLVVAAIAFIGFVLLLHTIVSLVQGRYLMPAFFTLQFALICAVPQRFYRLGARDAVYSVALTAIVAWHAAGFARQEQWKDLSARVGELKAACPGSRVYTGVWWVVATPNEGRVFNFAYESMSRRNGFRQEPIHVDVTPNPGSNCPDLFWFEHVDLARETDGEDIAAKFKQRIPNFRGTDIDVVVGKERNSLLFVARSAPPPSDTACNSAVCAGQ